MTRRNGSTLVELVLSMSAGSAIMLLAISLVHQTMTLTEKSRHRSDNNRTLDQLAHHFRRDVHLAAEINVDANDTLSIKSTDGSQVDLASDYYRIGDATFPSKSSSDAQD